MSGELAVWIVSLASVTLVGYAFGFASGRERERRKHLGRKRSCTNCRGWGHIRTGLPLIGMTWPCPDCNGFGFRREQPKAGVR